MNRIAQWFGVEDSEIPVAKYVLLALLLIIAIVFSAAWYISLRRNRQNEGLPNWYLLVTGFITDFFDTLGVGSFATTTALFRFGGVLKRFIDVGKKVDDEKIPGTLNVGHTLPTILQALIYINAIEIDVTTLWLLIVASVVGSYLGASFVSRLPRRSIQFGMGIAMLIAVTLILAKILKWIPEGGQALGLSGVDLALGLVGNFIFGALMTIGIGAYAPIMIMVSLLGMNKKSAFPLMMGSCAFLMPVASYRFIRSGRYDTAAALGLTLAGLPGVLIAAKIVEELPLAYVNWLVVFVVTYTALTLLYSASNPSGSAVSDSKVD